MIMGDGGCEGRGGANPESIWVCTVSGFLCSRVSAKISGNMGVLAQKYPESGQLYTKICQKKGDKKQFYLVSLREMLHNYPTLRDNHPDKKVIRLASDLVSVYKPCKEIVA